MPPAAASRLCSVPRQTCRRPRAPPGPAAVVDLARGAALEDWTREQAWNIMRALQLVEDRRLTPVDLPPPPAPAHGEVTLRIRAVALNHIDVWGWRGMAFAKRKMPLVIGAEASGEVDAIGPT